MADSSSSKPPEKKELSVEIRLLLAFVLMGVVLFTTPYLFKTPAPPLAPDKKTEAVQTGQPAPPPPVTPSPVTATTPAPAGQVSAAGEETAIVDTDVYRIVFSNRGAVVLSWILKKYKDSHGKPLEIVNTTSTPHPFSLGFPNQKPAVDLNSALYAIKRSHDGLAVSFEFSDGKVFSKKGFRFLSNSYQSQVSTEVRDGGAPVPHLIEWRGGFGDMTVPSPAAAQHSVHFDPDAESWWLPISRGKVLRITGKDAKDKPPAKGAFTFSGMEDAYFTAVFLPEDGLTEFHTLDDTAPTPHNPTPERLTGASVGCLSLTPAAPANGASNCDGVNRMPLFVGPKDLDILKEVNPKLERLIDFGMFSFIAKPLFLVMHWLTENYIKNYGWSIILMTVFINFALFPLKITSMKSMKKMQALQPQIAAINDRYKNVGMRDPKKQEQNQEVMALYQKHGVNPLGGCMPMLLQMPFLFAFYTVFSVAIEMRGASWLWVTDLSQHESIPIHILPILMIATQFIMQKMTPTTGGDPAQQKMMMFMPVIFGFMFYSQSSGLVLYWLTGNLVNIAQQWFFNRTSLASVAAESVQLAKKKTARK